jgi:hypothetical protein
MHDVAMTLPGGRVLLSNPDERGLAGLLLKGCIKAAGVYVPRGSMFYSTTPFGYALAKAADTLLLAIPELAEGGSAAPEGATPGDIPPPG